MSRGSNHRAIAQWDLLVLLPIMLVIAGGLVGGLASAEPKNPDAAKIKNPEPSTPESIAEGKKHYLRHCASCHGKTGKGDGGLALSGGEPSNLTDDVWDFGDSDGEIFVVIRDGTSADMLAYKEKLKEKEIWQVINFIRSIGPKKE